MIEKSQFWDTVLRMELMVLIFVRVYCIKDFPLYHSFTCCDTTSDFFGKEKKVAREAWNSYPEVTRAYMALNPHNIGQ